MKIYIRFTEDIYKDIDRGYSYDFRTKKPLAGLCAWGTGLDTREHTREEIISECKRKANQIAKNSYGGYSSNNEVAIIVADYSGQSNDGYLVKNVSVYSTFTI